MKLRVHFTKTGKIRFTSHRDLARVWERALRVAGVPVRYSEGYSPRMRISFGLALPTGYESDAEYLDLGLTTDEAPAASDLTAALPSGLDVIEVAPVDARTPSLQEAVTSCTWRVETDGLAADDLAARVREVLAETSLPIVRHRKGKEVADDLRPALIEARVDHTDGVVQLTTELAARPRTARPTELVDVLGGGLRAVRCRRLDQWIDDEAGRRRPIDAPASGRNPHDRRQADRREPVRGEGADGAEATEGHRAGAAGPDPREPAPVA